MSPASPERRDPADVQALRQIVPTVLTNLATFCRSMIGQSLIPLAITGGPDHTLQCVSPGFARLFKQEPAAMCGQPLGVLLASIQSVELLAVLDQVYTTGKAVSIQEDLHTHPVHGPIAWSYMICPLLDSAGRPSELFLEIQDTTASQVAAHVAAEIQAINEQLVLMRLREQTVAEDLAHQLAFIQALTQSLSEGVYALDMAGRVSYMNPSAERMVGVAAVELLGRPAHEVIALRFGSESSSAHAARPFSEVISSGVPYRHDDVVLTRRSGETMNVIYTLAPILSGSAIIGAVAVLHDVSALQRLQATREEYMTLMSHDLRSPLTTILGTAGHLRRRLQKHSLVREIAQVKTIIDSSRRMDAMIQDVLDRSTIETGSAIRARGSIDLVQIMRHMLEQVLTETDRNRIRLETVERLLIVGDVHHIERLLVNLLSNALKYSPPDSPVEVRLYQQERQALLTIRDHGVGIHPEEIPRLFAKYYRARTSGGVEGTGLGLYSSQLIVAAHNGRLWVESEVGVGSTFLVAFPVAPTDG